MMWDRSIETTVPRAGKIISTSRGEARNRRMVAQLQRKGALSARSRLSPEQLLRLLRAI